MNKKVSNITTIIKYRHFKILAAFCFLAIIIRFFTYFPSVIDHDESTYLEIARMILAGKTLYVDMVDIKPPGIFLILAGFQAVFGYSIFIIRLLVSIWIGLTAFLLYQTSRLILKDERAAVATGIIYILLISTWSFYGISITPEIFFNLFTIAALYVLLKKQNRMWLFLAGLIAGAGFMVKYLVLLDFAAFILFIIFLWDRKKPLTAVGTMLSLFLAATGFLIPFALTNLWYYLNGHFNEFYNIVYLAPSRYPSAFNPMKMLKFLLDFHLRFLPVFLMYYYVLLRKNNGQDNITGLKQLGIIWSVFVLFAVLISGKTFGHYMIQLMLPVSIVAGGFLYNGIFMPPGMERFMAGKWVFVFIAVLLTGITLMKLEYIFKKDIPREIAAYLKPRLNAEDVIYTGNYHHIIYYLLKKDSPTKYIHRSLLLEPNHVRALDIDVKKEFLHIMEQKPLYIIIKHDYPDGTMKTFILENYQVEKQFAGEVYLYRKNLQ